MANIETWCSDGTVIVHTAADTPRCVVIRVEGSSHNGSLRVTTEEAIALRDQLADALTKLSIERDAQTQHTPDFTPGMWEACGPFVRTRITPDDRRGSQVAAIHPSVERPSWAAALMAAAPELLAAAAHAEAWIGDMPHGDNCYLSAHYDGDPGNQCNCGKESVLTAIQTALAKARGDA